MNFNFSKACDMVYLDKLVKDNLLDKLVKGELAKRTRRWVEDWLYHQAKRIAVVI